MKKHYTLGEIIKQGLLLSPKGGKPITTYNPARKIIQERLQTKYELNAKDGYQVKKEDIDEWNERVLSVTTKS